MEARDHSRSWPRAHLIILISVSLVLALIVTPLVFLWLDRSGTLSVTIRSQQDEPVHFRAYVDDAMMAEDTLVPRGRGTYNWPQQWWLNVCVNRTVRVEYTDASGPSNRTSQAAICDGGTSSTTIAI